MSGAFQLSGIVLLNFVLYAQAGDELDLPGELVGCVLGFARREQPCWRSQCPRAEAG